VVKSFPQISGFDYDKIFAPVMQYDSVQLVLVLAAQNSRELIQADTKSVFLHGHLQEEIWTLSPSGIGLSGKILCLKKSLYGLK
jgi:hypothetical protein